MCVRTTEAKRRYRNSSQAPARPWDTLCRELVAMSETLHLQSVAGITLIRNLSLSILGFGTSKLVFGGISPFSSTMIALMIPATPLVPSRWPMFDFAAPLHAVNTRRKNEARQRHTYTLAQPRFGARGMHCQWHLLRWGLQSICDQSDGTGSSLECTGKRESRNTEVPVPCASTNLVTLMSRAAFR